MEYQILQSIQQFLVIGVNHKSCPVGTREKFHLGEEEKNQLIREAKNCGIESIIPVSTCNRTELYAYTRDNDLVTYLLKKYSRTSLEEIIFHCYTYKGQSAVKHLFEVSCGLDSQILGELEISGQLKKSFQEAYELEAVNTFSDRLIQYVNKASKKIKTKTELSTGAASTSRAAVQSLRERIDNIQHSRVLLYGTGDIGKETCNNLLKYIEPGQLTVVNRTSEKAKELADEYECNYNIHENINEEVERSDVVIVATGATKPTITEENFDGSHHKNNTIVLDLSVPRNVSSPVSNKVNTLITIDELQEHNREVLKAREESIPKAYEIIGEQTEGFYNWLKINHLSPVFSGFQDYLKSVKQKEVHKYKGKIPENQMEQVEEITNNIINKISSQAISYLRKNNANGHTPAEVITSMFGLKKN